MFRMSRAKRVVPIVARPLTVLPDAQRRTINLATKCSLRSKRRVAGKG
jgi:hypothetical protein